MASPEGPDLGRPGGDDELESELAAICSIDHFDWLAVITALAEGGPGTAASAADLAAYVRDYDPEEPEGADDLDDSLDEEDDADEDLFLSEDDEFDDLTLEGMFLPVVSLWQVLGAIDDDRLTPLGWWGLPEAMLRVWASSESP